MKRPWIIGAVIAALVGLNLFQGALLLGQNMGQGMGERHWKGRPDGGMLVLRHVRELPPAQRQQARDMLRDRTPGLRKGLKDARRMRRDIADYIAGPDYNRAEADRRLSELRKATLANQYAAQTIMLDIADTLPPEGRRKLMKGE